MPKIRLRNTLTRTVEEFVPLDGANVRMYLCGPTVYDRAHIGNARNVIVFDVLFRLLQNAYGEEHVTYVRNFTDVDDKINARAAETGRPIGEITAQTTQWYLDDMDALGNLRPTHMPRATDYIAQMIAMIEALIARGHAYAAEGHVLFDVHSYPDYGRLSGRSVEDMIAGARVEIAPYKRDPMDFVLWKPSAPGLPGWESPWGRGRPGWHIECSAMSHAILGASFDIHGGGLDLQFPHHENEIAQSCCAHPEGEFARYWLHNEMVVVDGRKMSKSLGNFFTVRDLLDQGWPPEVIRFVYLMTHYSKPMDWTEAKAREAEKTLRKWRNLLAESEISNPAPDLAVLEAIADDLNTASALSILHQQFDHLRRQRNAQSTEESASRPFVSDALDRFVGSAKLLGLLSDELGDWWQEEADVPTESFIMRVDREILERAKAKENRDYAKADKIRQRLAAIGITLSDGKDGTSWMLDASNPNAGSWDKY